jgi:hypothetical protein
MTRALVIASILVAGTILLPHGSADARSRWCAEYGFGGAGGARNCGFHNYEQCRAAISGNGGSCYPKP